MFTPSRLSAPGRLSVFPLLVSVLFGVAIASGAEAEDATHHLRGYGVFETTKTVTPAATTWSLRFEDPARARLFVSKVYSDYERSPGHRLETWPLPGGEVDAIVLDGSGYLLPLLAEDGRFVTLLAGTERAALSAAAADQPRASLLRRTEVRHPPFMDKFDRHALGIWEGLGDPEKSFPDPRGDWFKTHGNYHKWTARYGVTEQLNAGQKAVDLANNANQTLWQRRQLAATGTNYQRVEWLIHHPDLYNRNPFLTHTRNPHVLTRWDYYGERHLADSPLREVQNANHLAGLRPTLDDANQMALLDPNGEIGPFEYDEIGLRGPLARREFVRFLQEVRGLSLEETSRRYYGRPDALPDWEALELVDWRTFYGWTDGALDLAGEWRFMRDARLEGFTAGWTRSDYDDTDWIRLHYPVDGLIGTLVADGKPVWMRKTFTVAPAAFPEGARIFLTLAPLTHSPVQVYLNGRPLTPLNPPFHTARVVGQFDITEEVRAGGSITVAMRLMEPPAGPMFLTPRAMTPFPTEDERLNARRWDHVEFTDWAVARAVATSWSALRAVEPDRPLKIHAYGGSPWGWKNVARHGGFSHHTGSSPGWIFMEPTRYGSARHLQHSSEPPGPMGSARDFRGLWGALAAMGMNAHDYFINPQSILSDPEKQAFLESRIADIKTMGRARLRIAPIAAMRGPFNTHYEGEFARWESWRHGVQVERGGEVVPLLDEVRVREGDLGEFAAIIDEGTPGWDAEMTSALAAYVEDGGTLFLNQLSGMHDFITRDANPGPLLAGVLRGETPSGSADHLIFDQPDETLGGWGADGPARVHGRPGLRNVGLEPATPEVEVLARWPDGSAALTRRARGKGRIYYCGAAIYPQTLLDAVAKVYGPATHATAQGGVDLVRTAMANNGAEEMLMLRGRGDAPVSVVWTLEQPPAAGAVMRDAASGEVVPARVDGRVVTFETTIGDWDFRWFSIRTADPAAMFSHWLRRQTEIWGGLGDVAREPVAEPFRHLDLNAGWMLARAATPAEAEALLDRDDDPAWQPADLIFWNVPGTDTPDGEGLHGAYRRVFDLPAAWRADNRFELVVAGYLPDSRLHGFQGPGRIRLNGEEIGSGERLESLWLDVTDRLRPEGNRLEILHPAPGILPVVRLVRTAVPEDTIPLDGEWRAVQGLHEEVPVILPTDQHFKAGLIYRDFHLPAELADREIWLRVDGPRITSVYINGRHRHRSLRLAPDTGRSPRYEIDITPDLRFNGDNRIVVGGHYGDGSEGWINPERDFKEVALLVYRPGQWSADGRDTRSALTPAELASVAADTALFQAFPMTHPQREKAAPTPDADTIFASTALPAALLDLELDEGLEGLRDRSPSAVPLVVQGNVEAFSEAGGRRKGVYFRGEADHPGGIDFPGPVARRLLDGKPITMRAWVKPLAINRPGGPLLNWNSYVFDWRLADDRIEVALPTSPPRRLILNAVLAQQAWQCLTLVLEAGPDRPADAPACVGTLYWNGIAVGRQEWDRSLAGADSPLTLGRVNGHADFLNARLAAFTIFPGAFQAREVAGLYEIERERFETPPGDYPEDDRFRLDLTGATPRDAADIPAQIVHGEGVGVETDGKDRVLRLSGKESYLLFDDNRRIGLFHQPFTLVLDFKPEPGASGMIFRRHHALCLELTPNGTLRLDANIGRNRRLDFPDAIVFGEWNRVRFSYDGRSARLEVNDLLVGEEDYEGHLATGSFYPLVFFADNTWNFPHFRNLACLVRELRLMPDVRRGHRPAGGDQ